MTILYFSSYLPPSYPYMDPSYNPMSMMTDEAKMTSQNPGPGMKEIPSPNEHSKMVNSQVRISNLMIYQNHIDVFFSSLDDVLQNEY